MTGAAIAFWSRGGHRKAPVREQSGVGERRLWSQAVAERTLARPIELWIGKQEKLSAAPHPLIQLNQDVCGLGARVRHQQQPLPLQALLVRDTDRHHLVALFQPAKRWRSSVFQSELLSEDQWKAGDHC